MNSAPLLLLPLATVALLSSHPAKESRTAHADADQVAAILDRPEFRALVEQLQQAASTLDLPGEEDQRAFSRHRRNRAPQHEQGLHTGHLTQSDFNQPEAYFSPARGLTPEDEWQQMFPRYALKLAAAR